MKHFYLSFILIGLLFSSIGNAQTNLTQVGHLAYPDELNDVWGYVDETGIEYALVGTVTGFSVVSLADPTNPTQVYFIPGATTTWRDVKIWDDHAFVTNEGDSGMLIVNLGPLPGFTQLPYKRYTGDQFPFTKSHNIHIDTLNGIACLFGTNGGNESCYFLNLDDPWNPTEMGKLNLPYGHDGFLENDILYNSHIEEGYFGIWDVSDKSDPQLLQTRETPAFNAHNCWPNYDRTELYTTDEIDNGYVGSYDISDFSNIKELDRFQSSPGQNVVPHNVYYHNGYLVVSYYTDGVVIVDAHRGDNLVQVGNFDTSPNFSGSGFNGCWGVYPYLPSGLILATDIEEGLFVLDPNYQRAAYLEGEVRDLHTNLPIPNVKVEVIQQNDSLFTNIKGGYKTGYLQGGAYTVIFSHPDYPSDTQVVLLTNLFVTQLDVFLDNWPASVPQVLPQESVSLFPNPSAEGFRLSGVELGEGTTVQITNALGKVVEQETLFSNATLGQSLPTGWYVVELVQQGVPVWRQKWVKQESLR